MCCMIIMFLTTFMETENRTEMPGAYVTNAKKLLTKSF